MLRSVTPDFGLHLAGGLAQLLERGELRLPHGGLIGYSFRQWFSAMSASGICVAEREPYSWSTASSVSPEGILSSTS